MRRGGRLPVQCRTFSSIPPPTSSQDIKNVWRHCHQSLGHKVIPSWESLLQTPRAMSECLSTRDKRQQNYLLSSHLSLGDSLVAQTVKNRPVMQETRDWSLGRDDPLMEGATYSSTLAWRILWTEEPGRLQSMESQRVGYDWVTNTFTFFTCHLGSSWCGC